MYFFQNPEIILSGFFFFFFFSHFYLDYFRVLMVFKYIESMYLVLEEKTERHVFRIFVVHKAWCIVPDF